jgi:predicted ArsR family transcriptional regulator
MQTTTRLKILDFLRTHQTATAAELSNTLGMTGANVRNHLQILKSNDLIELVGKRQVGRGRPDNIFALSRQMLGDGMDVLSHALCSALLGNLSPVNLEPALRKTALIMAGGDKGSLNIPLQQRLSTAIDHLNKMHYTARWEAAAEGPRFILGHCPYAVIIDSHPELCQLDGELLNSLTGLSLIQTEKLQMSGKGLSQCIFQPGI